MITCIETSKRLALSTAAAIAFTSAAFAGPPSSSPSGTIMTSPITASPAAMTSINPAAGPKIPGISAAMAVAPGRLLFLSGHVPLDSAGQIAGPDLAAQLKKVFENLALSIAEAGGGFEHVARVTIYVAGLTPAMMPAIRGERDKWINLAKPPASTVLGVQSFYRPDILVEVEAIALLPD